MSDWLPLCVPLGASAAIIFVLGAPISFALRLRGFAFFTVGVPAAFAILALTPVVTGFLGFEWNIAAPIALTFMIALALWLCRRWLSTTPRKGLSQKWLLPLGASALGGIMIGVALINGLKRADAVSQTYDAIFHLNAVRQILESGNSSPFAMDLTSPGSPSFYPTVWHGFVALVVQLTGTTIPIATNAVLFVTATIVWPIGLVALGRAVVGPSTGVTVSAGILAAAYPNFPLALTAYGVLYPNLLSIALVPFAIVAFMQLLALARAQTADPLSPVSRWLLLLGAAGAAILAHPNSLHVLLLWLAAPMLAAVVKVFRAHSNTAALGVPQTQQSSIANQKILAVLGVLLFVICCVIAWRFGRTSDNGWSGSFGPRSALLEAAGFTPHIPGHAWVLTVVFLIGCAIVVARRSGRWLVGVAAIAFLFYYIADGFPPAHWRTVFLSPWYNDPWRLAALIPLATFPLVLVGVSWIWGIIRSGTRVLAVQSHISRTRLNKIVATICGLALIAAIQGPVAEFSSGYLAKMYKFDQSSALLDPAEEELLTRLPSLTPSDAVIVNNPWNGGALAYALADRKVLFPHTGGNYDPRAFIVTEGISNGGFEACSNASELGATFLLDFGTQYVFDNDERTEPFENISGLSSSSALTEVDREGDAVLYAINCD